MEEEKEAKWIDFSLITLFVSFLLEFYGKTLRVRERETKREWVREKRQQWCASPLNNITTHSIQLPTPLFFNHPPISHSLSLSTTAQAVWVNECAVILSPYIWFCYQWKKFLPKLIEGVVVVAPFFFSFDMKSEKLIFFIAIFSQQIFFTSSNVRRLFQHQSLYCGTCYHQLCASYRM